LAEIITKQAVIMLLLIIVGYVLFKLSMLSENGVKEMSSLLLSVVNPVVILLAYQKDFSMSQFKGLIICGLLYVVSFTVAILVSYLLIRKKDGREADIERFSAIYTNCGFMGIPLVQSIFGSNGVFYLTAYITVFNILVWTHGYIMLSGSKNATNLVKVFFSPALVAIYAGLAMFILKIRIPSVILTGLDYLGAMNTPLAMIAAGATIAQTSLIKSVFSSGVYRVSLIKLLVIPSLLVLAFWKLPFDEMIKLTVIVASAAPSAAMCTLFCVKLNKNSKYASELFAFTTILSVLSLPLIMRLYDFIN
jgi:predicted permease